MTSSRDLERKFKSYPYSSLEEEKKALEKLKDEGVRAYDSKDISSIKNLIIDAKFDHLTELERFKDGYIRKGTKASVIQREIKGTEKNDWEMVLDQEIRNLVSKQGTTDDKYADPDYQDYISYKKAYEDAKLKYEQVKTKYNELLANIEKEIKEAKENKTDNLTGIKDFDEVKDVDVLEQGYQALEKRRKEIEDIVRAINYDLNRTGIKTLAGFEVKARERFPKLAASMRALQKQQEEDAILQKLDLGTQHKKKEKKNTGQTKIPETYSTPDVVKRLHQIRKGKRKITKKSSDIEYEAIKNEVDELVATHQAYLLAADEKNITDENRFSENSFRWMVNIEAKTITGKIENLNDKALSEELDYLRGYQARIKKECDRLDVKEINAKKANLESKLKIVFDKYQERYPAFANGKLTELTTKVRQLKEITDAQQYAVEGLRSNQYDSAMKNTTQVIQNIQKKQIHRQKIQAIKEALLTKVKNDEFGEVKYYIMKTTVIEIDDDKENGKKVKKLIPRGVYVALDKIKDFEESLKVNNGKKPSKPTEEESLLTDIHEIISSRTKATGTFWKRDPKTAAAYANLLRDVVPEEFKPKKKAK